MNTGKKNETRKNRFIRIMRSLHRDIGFLLIGLIVIYCLSGITLIYRDTSFLKTEKQITANLEPEMNTDEIGRALHMRNFEIMRTEGNLLYFNNGNYNRETGEITYTNTSLPPWLNKINSLHKSSTRNPMHWLGTIFGSLLFFMAFSSLWMFKKGTGFFRRGIILTVTGAVVVLLIIFV